MTTNRTPTPHDVNPAPVGPDVWQIIRDGRRSGVYVGRWIEDYFYTACVFKTGDPEADLRLARRVIAHLNADVSNHGRIDWPNPDRPDPALAGL